MKKLKKILNKSSELIYNFLEKIANFIKNENNALFIKSIIKVFILIIIYFICGLLAEGIIKIGTIIIFNLGTTARSLISGIWHTIVNFIYFLFIIVSAFKLTEMAEKDKNFFSLYKNKKKDNAVKKRIFFTIETIIKILGIIILIPLFTIDIALLFAFGIMMGYLSQGIFLYSLFVANISLIIIFTCIIFLIKALLSKEKNNLKKFIYPIIISGLFVSLSSVGLLIETSKYKVNQDLTTDFSISKMKYEYKINSNKEYIISNNSTDYNMELIIDDDLGSYLEVVVSHTTTNEVKASLKNGNNKVKISYDEDINIQFTDLEKIYNLALTSIKEKTIYNYTLLKYAKIEVRVSSDYAKNIKFIDSKGKEYKPYERLDK